MDTVMQRLWVALENISPDFNSPPDFESLEFLENVLAQAGLKVVEINHPAAYSAGILSQMG